MKTQRATTLRNFRILFVLVMALATVMLFAACANQGKTVVSKTLSNLPQVLYVEEFDPDMKNIAEAVDKCGITLNLEFSDGTKEDIPLTFDMLEDVYKQKLNGEGVHDLTYMYKGEIIEFRVSVQLTTTYTVRFLNAKGYIISEQKVEKGHSATAPSEKEREVRGFEFIEWDTSFDNITQSIDVYGIYERLISVSFYNCKNQHIETKYLHPNEDATAPDAESLYLPGYTFARWDTDFTNVQSDIRVYGIYIIDEETDTDGDGIIDYIEVERLNYDYTSKDTDGNGITDDKEDYDKDGSANLTEIKNGTSPDNPDTDNDGLIDGDEIDVYYTLPLHPDTDYDGAYDGWEVQNRFDPTVYNKTFEVQSTISMPDNSQITIDAEIPGNFLNKPIIEASTNKAIMDIHGAIGAPIQYNISASANITISSDELSKAADPVLMHFDTETKTVASIEVSVSGNKATASITTYGSYVLVDRKVFEEKGQWRDVFDGGNYTSIEIVFVVDDSGSLSSNDPSFTRLSVARDLIDALPQNAKVGVVLFDSSVENLTSGLTTKESAKSCLTKNYFNNSGNTKLYSGAMTALGLYSNKTDNDGVYRIMILLSDGQPTDSGATSVINSANNKGVKIYTVGLGDESSYFDKYLMPLSDGTDGEYTHASNASGLKEIYDNIGEKIDMEVDTDIDGLADFFESGVDKDGNPTLPTINGMSFVGLDKNNPDTDGDGYLDGQEIEIYLYYSDTNPNQVMVWGIVNSNPTDTNSIPVSK